jgi:hypothetical protein
MSQIKQLNENKENTEQDKEDLPKNKSQNNLLKISEERWGNYK